MKRDNRKYTQQDYIDLSHVVARESSRYPRLRNNKAWKVAQNFPWHRDMTNEEAHTVLASISSLFASNQVQAAEAQLQLFGGRKGYSLISEGMLGQMYEELLVMAMEMDDSEEEIIRDELLLPQESEYGNAIRAYFTVLTVAISRSIVRRINRGDTPEELSSFIDRSVRQSDDDLRPVLQGLITGGYLAGGQNFTRVARIPESVIGLSFDLLNVEATQYVRSETERLITQVSSTTHKILNDIVQKGIDEGLGANEIAKQIRGVRGYDNTLFKRDKNGRDRADRITARELNHRYSEGILAIGRQYDDEPNLSVEKKWKHSNDERVRPLHRTLGSTPWIHIDQAFPSGISPGSEPGCRCYLLIRIVTQEEN